MATQPIPPVPFVDPVVAPDPPVPSAPVFSPPVTKTPKPAYLIVALPFDVVQANAVLAKAAAQGYLKLDTVYVVSTPSSASTAFAVLSL
jgi:hypothetical protein